MPLVLRKGGVAFYIYLPPKEHGPPHVHARTAGLECEFWLTGAVKKNQGRLCDRDLRRIWRVIDDHIELFQEQWEVYHGKEEESSN
jgi:hypothetical protein